MVCGGAIGPRARAPAERHDRNGEALQSCQCRPPAAGGRACRSGRGALPSHDIPRPHRPHSRLAAVIPGDPPVSRILRRARPPLIALLLATSLAAAARARADDAVLPEAFDEALRPLAAASRT